ncbi:MAG: amidohydrolase family protein [Ilumatobacteraceae bacterium]
MVIASNRWAVVPDAIWDGNVKLDQYSIIVDGVQIHDVVKTSSLGTISRTELPGCTVIPGLIDAHVHLSEWMMPGFLAAGVTTVRDVGNDLGWVLNQRDTTSNDPSIGPTILCCGPTLDGDVMNWPRISRKNRDEVDIAQTVHDLIESGVDAIKLYVNLTKAQVASAVFVAHKSDIPVLAHLGSVSALDASELGVDEIEHLSGCIHHEHGGLSPFTDSEYLARCIDMFIEHDTVMCPTLVVWDRLAHMNDGIFPNDHRLAWVHPILKAAWSNFPHRYSDPNIRFNRQLSVVTMKKTLREMYSRGCRVIAGTDTPWPYVIPGFGLHDELALAVDSGISPTDALKMATINSAEVLGLSGKVGVITMGASANLVAVRGDPTKDITNLADVHWVLHRGVIVDREKLIVQRDFEFGREPTDAISELITNVARTSVLPISPSIRFPDRQNLDCTTR